uniref:KIB1-4 beta-propeller domain-containing protein n=1 Tax=Aegilops tauschii TaxID=37682 RepID=M8APU3_AEGTA
MTSSGISTPSSLARSAASTWAPAASRGTERPPLPLPLPRLRGSSPAFYSRSPEGRPAPARRPARAIGSYDGMWAFLALSSKEGHVLLNVRTGERIPLPDIDFGRVSTRCRAVRDDDGVVQSYRWLLFRGPRRSVMMLAATLSSAPAVDGKCIAGAILNVHGPKGVDKWRYVCFWRLASQTAIQSPEECSELVGWSAQDIAYFDGRFFVLTKGENLRAYTVLDEPDPLIGGDLGTRCAFYYTGRGDTAAYAEPRAGYLVESRGELLMVAKEWMPDDGATTCVRLFALTPVADPDPELSLAWTAIGSLDGRLLGVGPGCSRAYECADFPSGCVEEGVYFLDDRTYYNETYYEPFFPMQSNPGEFACADNGRCCLLPARPEHCFPMKPGEGSFSAYSPPVWLLP